MPDPDYPQMEIILKGPPALEADVGHLPAYQYRFRIYMQRAIAQLKRNLHTVTCEGQCSTIAVRDEHPDLGTVIVSGDPAEVKTIVASTGNMVAHTLPYRHRQEAGD